MAQKIISLETKKEQKRLDSLDGLRGFAAFLVFAWHSSGQNVNLIPNLILADSELGKAGVYLFFVLSSFLLTSQFLKSDINLNSFDLWKTYVKKRLLRIYPLYISVLIMHLIFWDYSAQKFLNHLLLVEGESCFWTVVVEIKFYLFLPLVVFLIVKKNHCRILPSALFLLLTFLSLFLLWISLDKVSPISILRYMPVFLIGSFAALIQSKILNSVLFSKVFFDSISLISISTIFISIWFIKEIPGSDGGNLWLKSLQFFIPLFYGTLWAFFLIFHLHGNIFRNFLTNPFIRYIGTVSFGVYLWHIPVLGYLNAHLNLPSPLKFVLIFSTTIAVSTFTFLLIERPFVTGKFYFRAVRL